MIQNSIVLVVCGLIALSAAMPFDVLPGGHIDDCRLCERIIGAAERHHHNNKTFTQDQLKRELDRECFQFTHSEGPDAAKKCADFVNAHITTIYNDIVAGKRPRAVCDDLGKCDNAPTTGAPPPNEAPEELAQHDPCQICRFIIGRAEHHFKPNETSDQLKHHLERECKQIAQLQGQQAAAHCKTIVDNNIQTIYTDIQAGKRPHQICVDIGECGGPGGSSMPPPPPPMSTPGMLAPEILPRPHDPCRTCEFIIGRAEHHIHNGNVTDENRLLRELEHECIQLAHVEGDQAAVSCLNIIQKDIDMIFNDINSGKRPRQICEDMGECTAHTGGFPTGFPTGFPPMTTAGSFIKRIFNIFH